MRISLFTDDVLYPLAGEAGVSERAHSSAGELLISAQAVTQDIQRLRASHTAPRDRENLLTQIQFSTARQFPTATQADEWALLYDATLPRAGTVYLDSIGPDGSITRHAMANAVISPPTRKLIGRTVMLNYSMRGGEVTFLEFFPVADTYTYLGVSYTYLGNTYTYAPIG